jgi:hypothetical protein
MWTAFTGNRVKEQDERALNGGANNATKEISAGQWPLTAA